DKRKLFSVADTSGESAPLPPVVIRSPRNGTLLTVHASPGQYVPAAAPLVTVADMSQLWVRVPVPEQFLPQVDQQRAVRVALKSGVPASSQAAPNETKAGVSFEAKPVALVPQVDPTGHTADMLYELPAGRPPLAKDQMVTVYVPLGRQR